MKRFLQPARPAPQVLLAVSSDDAAAALHGGAGGMRAAHCCTAARVVEAVLSGSLKVGPHRIPSQMGIACSCFCLLIALREGLIGSSRC